MKQKNEEKSLTKTEFQDRKPSNFSMMTLFEKLPNWLLVPTVVTIFGLLLTDVVITDPLPFVDEAALFWAMLSGMRVLSQRRKLKRLESGAEPIEAEYRANPDSSPGQPKTLPTI